MYYWLIHQDRKTGKLTKSGPYLNHNQAQRKADDDGSGGGNYVIPSRSRDWGQARGEVKQKLSEHLKDLGVGAKRVMTISEGEG